MPGAGLSWLVRGKVLLYMPAFQPYRGKPAVRNDREGRGNVGIIRSPLRASTLPDCGGHEAARVPTAKEDVALSLAPVDVAYARCLCAPDAQNGADAGFQVPCDPSHPLLGL